MAEESSRCWECGEVLTAEEVEVNSVIDDTYVWLAYCTNMKCPRYGLYTKETLKYKNDLNVINPPLPK